MRAIRNLTPFGGSPITVSSLAARAISAKSPRTPVPKPQSHHRTGTDLELPEWLPPQVASYARQINCGTKSDELMLRRLTSDPRMKVVWSELLKRKRTDYKSSDAFAHPATARKDWYPGPRELLRRAQAIRQMSGPYNEGEAKKLELLVDLDRERRILPYPTRNYRPRSTRCWPSSLKHSNSLEPIPGQSLAPLPNRSERTTATWPTEFGPTSPTWICSLPKY